MSFGCVFAVEQWAASIEAAEIILGHSQERWQRWIVMVIALMALAFFGKGLAAVGWAVLSDTAPKNMVGLSGGVFNGIGNIAGIITPVVIGYFVASTGSFNSALWFVAAHDLIGIFGYVVLAGPFERVVIEQRIPSNDRA